MLCISGPCAPMGYLIGSFRAGNSFGRISPGQLKLSRLFDYTVKLNFFLRFTFVFMYNILCAFLSAE